MLYDLVGQEIYYYKTKENTKIHWSTFVYGIT